MSNQGLIVKLSRFYPVLLKLPSNLQRALADSSYPVQAAADCVLVEADSIIQSFLLLTQGSIRVILSGKERELLLYRVQPGGCCVISICHLLGDTRYRARAKVETAIQGIALPKPLFLKMVEQSPSFGYFIMRAFSDRYTQLLELMERVTSLRLDERLARLLVSRGPCIQTTHIQLADELGSVREVISRILKGFEARGLIRLERGYIEILDMQSLRQMFDIGDSSHRLT